MIKEFRKEKTGTGMKVVIDTNILISTLYLSIVYVQNVIY